MDMLLLYLPKKMTFTDDSTGEVVSGGKVALCDIESKSDSQGLGRFTDIKWVTGDIIDKLYKQLTADKFPVHVKVILTNRGLSSKPRIEDIVVVEEK